VGLALCIVAGLLKLGWDAQFYDDYAPDAPLNVVIRGVEDRAAYQRIDFTFDGVPGEPVPTLMARPREDTGPVPALIFLHGIGQQKGFLDSIAGPFVEAGFAFLCFDQFTRGERKADNLGLVGAALAFRRRAALTVIETRRLIDFLRTQPAIDPDRIFLLGASYGAVTGSAAMAFDERIRAGVLCYGGGDLAKLIDSDVVREEVGGFMWAVQRAVAFLLAPAEPLRHVHKIAPRPVLFQAGRHDTVVPPAAAAALIEAAKEPKDVIWYESDHVGLDPAHVETVLNDALVWLKAHDPAR